MHIPDHMIVTNNVPFTTAIISSIGVSITTYLSIKFKEKIDLIKFAIITSIVFVLQMLNFPIQNGTSGHFLGTTLLILLLGIPYGILAMTIILIIQCFIFADGGISVLGANILNMAFIGAIPGIFLTIFLKKEKFNIILKSLFIFLASWFSIILSAFSCSLELALSNTISAIKVIPSMLRIHSIIGIFEGIITILLFSLVSLVYTNRIYTTKKRWLTFTVLGAILVIGIILSPFASPFPDGLEWIAEQYDLIHSQGLYFVSPLVDYKIPLINNDFFSTVLATFLGTIIVFLIVILTGKTINLNNKLKILKKE